MTRIMEALKLREKGLSYKAIAEKMGIRETTATVYVANAKKELRGNKDYRKKYEKRYHQRDRTKRIRQVAKEIIYKYNLPHKWENELTQMVILYLADKRGTNLTLDVESIALLLCRKKRFPSPRELVEATWQGKGANRVTCGYMHVLEVMNGLTVSTPQEYLVQYIEQAKLNPKITKRALETTENLNWLLIQGKNPRTVASAILWLSSRQLWLEGNLAETEMLTQRELAEYFEVTTVSVRNIAKILNPKRYEQR